MPGFTGATKLFETSVSPAASTALAFAGGERAPARLGAVQQRCVGEIAFRDSQLLAARRADSERVPAVGFRGGGVELHDELRPQLGRELVVHRGQLALFRNDRVGRAG